MWLCKWNTQKLEDFMLLQGGGTSKYVILQGEGTCGSWNLSYEIILVVLYLGYSPIGRFPVLQGEGTYGLSNGWMEYFMSNYFTSEVVWLKY